MASDPEVSSWRRLAVGRAETASAKLPQPLLDSLQIVVHAVCQHRRILRLALARESLAQLL